MMLFMLTLCQNYSYIFFHFH